MLFIYAYRILREIWYTQVHASAELTLKRFQFFYITIAFGRTIFSIGSLKKQISISMH